jgi:aspartate/methionine/tyrosine aminotransferase
MALKSARRGHIDPFIVMEVMRAANARAAEGADVLHLEVGQPASGAPAGVLAAAHAALDGDRLGYTEAFGLPALRTAIAGHYRHHYGLQVPESRIAVTTGSSAGFLLSFLAAFDVGDRVAMAAPSYPAYRNILSALGVEVVELPAGPDERYQPTVALLEAETGPLHGLILASPSNPAGTMIEADAFADLVAYCTARDIRLVSDEIYHGITFGGPREVPALALTQQAVVINSFSKYFSMTGWRLGWMVLPEDLLRPVECLSQNLFISPPALSQRAGIAAFACGDELDAHVRRYAENRAILLEALPRAGFTHIAPADGAFYIYFHLRPHDPDSLEFCRLLLEQTGVAATPGVDFDPARGHRTVRLSFAGATGEIRAAAARLCAWAGVAAQLAV